MNRKLIIAWLFIVSALAPAIHPLFAQYMGRGGRSIHQVFASDYGDTRDSYVLNTVLSAIGTSRWMSVVMDGGTWMITNNVTVPSNVYLVYARGSSLDVQAGSTVTVNTVWDDVQYSAEYAASTAIYANAYFMGTKSASTNLTNVFYLASNPDGYVTSDEGPTNGFTSIAPVTSPAFYGGAFLSTGGNTIASGTLSGAPVGTNNTVYGNNSMVLAGRNNVISNANSTASGTGNLVGGESAAAFGYENTAAGAYSFAAGRQNSASGIVTTALGYLAEPIYPYSFVWNDSLGGAYRGNASNSFNVSATGGFYLGTNLVFNSAGHLQNAANTNSLLLSSDSISVGTSANGSDYGVAIGLEANGYLYGVGVGYQAKGVSGVAVGYTANGYQGVAVGYKANAYQGMAIGLEANGYSGAAAGPYANGYNGAALGDTANGYYGAAVGRKANGWYGVAIGAESTGAVYGVAVGNNASGGEYGTAIGLSSVGDKKGVAVGYMTSGSYSNIAIGNNAFAGNDASHVNRIAIGNRVTNTVNDSFMARGTLYLDGGTGVLYRSTFGTGSFTPLVSGFSGATTNRSTIQTTVVYYANGLVTSNQYYGP